MLIYSVGNHILWVVSIVGSDLWWIKKWKILLPAFYYIPLEYILHLSVTSITYIYMSKFLTGPYVYLLVVICLPHDTCMLYMGVYLWSLTIVVYYTWWWSVVNTELCYIYINPQECAWCFSHWPERPGKNMGMLNRVCLVFQWLYIGLGII